MKFYIGDNPKIERVHDNGIDKYAITGKFISKDFVDLKTATRIFYKLMEEGFEIKE